MERRSQHDQPFVAASHAELVTHRCQDKHLAGLISGRTLPRIIDTMNVCSLYEDTTTGGAADRRLGAPCMYASHITCDTQIRGSWSW